MMSISFFRVGLTLGWMSSTFNADLMLVYLFVTWNTVPKEPLEIFLWIVYSLSSYVS